ncbi:hypothetical protein [Desulfosarcina cetonica]|uniref:hypothetical protein n=1 Tax=Desulfosarcina cetonica TaxID=90730 RepID=UPI0006CF5A6F|nr:hypothetical protein [Desulfosarcina cetonica]
MVAKALAGKEDQIKGYAVATEVFGRREDFDQATDPVVSIQANKLRRALERYYLVAGRNDPLRIDIPKGTYVPTFQQRCTETETALPHDDHHARTCFEITWPSLAVQPLVNLTGNPELEHVGAAIASEIASEITCYQEIRVILQFPEKRKRRATDKGARFVLSGSINTDLSNLKASVILTDLSTGMQIWADTYRAALNPAHLMIFAEEVARTVAGKSCAEYGIIAKQLSVESKHTPPRQLTTYEAMLRYHEFNAQYTHQAFLDAMRALQQASKSEPDCGLVWSLMARLYAINYGTELFAVDTPIDEAVGFAQTGAKLDPGNQRTRGALSFALMLANEISAARVEADRALALNPDSLIFLDGIGYLLTLLGDWQRGPALIRKAIDINPYYNPIVHHALWLDMFRRLDYRQAYLETLNFKTPNLFWEHVMKAATLGHLGRIPEGCQVADGLLTRKPDFAQRGNFLIRHFIKFDEIVERMLVGLSRVGIDVEGN